MNTSQKVLQILTNIYESVLDYYSKQRLFSLTTFSLQTKIRFSSPEEVNIYLKPFHKIT